MRDRSARSTTWPAWLAAVLAYLALAGISFAQQVGGAPAADDRAVALLGHGDDLVGGVQEHADLIGGEALEQACMTIE